MMWGWGFSSVFMITSLKFLRSFSMPVTWKKNSALAPTPFLFPGSDRPQGVDFHLPHLVSDESFKRLVAILRLSVPYTGMIISTRESVEMRAEAFDLGISQTSAGSRTSPGGYGQQGEEEKSCTQCAISNC